MNLWIRPSLPQSGGARRGETRLCLRLASVALAALLSAWTPRASAPAPTAKAAPEARPYAEAHAAAAAWSTADHAGYAALKGPFPDGDGSAVTRACLTCHTKAADQVMRTKHWLWRSTAPGYEAYGKGGLLINNFCISVTAGNYPACTKCHAGYGWKDKNYDFTKADDVDCLVCHDRTGDYEKEAAGLPNPAVPLDEVAQHVGRPGLANCGTCHFFGGGADATKHGELDDTLLTCDKSEDVHMAKNGAGMDCVDCHTTHGHDIAGPDYPLPADMQDRPSYPGEKLGRMSCAACHSESPHKSFVLNRHYRKVACQTCHIPAFARGSEATNVWWDWSTAGKTKDGRAYEDHDAEGNVTYATIHGTMVWKRNVEPSYFWFDGQMHYMLVTDSLPKERPVWLNTPKGSYGEEEAKIWPFKVHEGNQPYDTQLNKLAVPHLYGEKGSGAFWVDHDWPSALKVGMQDAGLPYSGRYGFVRTNMLWPITHMVAPAKAALGCRDCHSPGGRIAGLKGFYVPARDRFRWLDWLGVFAILATCLAVAAHAAFRIIYGARRSSR